MCEACVGAVTGGIMEYLLSEENLAKIILHLSGEQFCMMDDDPLQCVQHLHVWLPVALPVVARIVKV